MCLQLLLVWNLPIFIRKSALNLEMLVGNGLMVICHRYPSMTRGEGGIKIAKSSVTVTVTGLLGVLVTVL